MCHCLKICVKGWFNITILSLSDLPPGIIRCLYLLCPQASSQSANTILFFSNCVFSFFFLVEGRFFPVRQSLPFLSDDFTLHSPPSLLRVTFLPIFLTLLVFALVGIQMCGKNKHCTHVWRHAQTRFEETKLGVIFLFSQKASP